MPHLMHPDRFVHRHIGPRDDDQRAMLETLGCDSLDDLVARALPTSILTRRPLALAPPLSEVEAMGALARMAGRNRVLRSYIGRGFHGTITPAVIRRNVLENPGWYTQYTPYQAEIAQGRLEALLNFQTLVASLTGLPVANASLLDEATAAAEAMTLCARALERGGLGPVLPRERPLPPRDPRGPRDPGRAARDRGRGRGSLTWDFSGRPSACSSPTRRPTARCSTSRASPSARTRRARSWVVAADLLALTLFREPGTIGADVAIGSAQRFGVPLWFGGPHAAYMAVRDGLKRHLPGRLVGVSKDAQGHIGYRLALQTRSSTSGATRRTSNICTAQVLLAVTASMYAVYHGPEGLRAIAAEVRRNALRLRAALLAAGCGVRGSVVFDTLRVTPGPAGTDEVVAGALTLESTCDATKTAISASRSTRRSAPPISRTWPRRSAPPRPASTTPWTRRSPRSSPV
jgi:glycine dehydrogenase